ncbi:MAG: pallilysin-related adhesin [Treponema sp.]|nr:pallilysin-related adhesin [Treponema sp.]
MKRLIPALFIAVAALLAIAFLCRDMFESGTEVVRARVITPIVQANEDTQEKISSAYSDNWDDTSFIALSKDETLISTVSTDVDSDGYDDQINVVRSVNSQNLQLVFALYNAASTRYDRTLSLETNISQVRSFVCTGLDVIGRHRSSVVYQGVAENGHSVLRIYNGTRDKDGIFSLDLIGDFEADGTVFIQQIERDESYDASLARGSSFPVWVYTTEPRQGTSAYDQIQTMYNWSEREGQYVQVSQTRVAGSRIAAKELERIQDGTVETFARFLDGLWYKVDNSGSEVPYIFFDWAASELIFQQGDSEEVYSWQNSSLRRGGMYFSSVNKSIENLQRRVDISLISVDEVRIRIQDDVRMIIGESTLWDGNYKKMSSVTKLKGSVAKDSTQAFVEDSLWASEDGTRVRFTDSGYSTSASESADWGRFMRFTHSGLTFLQFRPDSTTPFFNGMYLPSYSKTMKTETSLVRGKRVSVEKEVDDVETVILHPVTVTPEGYFVKEASPITLHDITKEQELALAADKNAGVNSVAVSDPVSAGGPSLSVLITPQYFSPDGDGEYDEMFVQLKVDSAAPVKYWSFIVRDSDNRREFWSVRGQSDVKSRLVWNGRSSRGELVQSATDYPYIFSVTDANGVTNEVKGMVQVDILVIKEGSKLKMQVPSIIFRSDAADFKSTAEVRAEFKASGIELTPAMEETVTGLDTATIENNVRVLSRIADILKKFPDYNVSIEGNANNLSGTADEEREVQQLSEGRARFVRSWLIRQGIAAARLTAVGNGSKNPLIAADDLADRWKNRRVEFILQK